jgi:hypothetical protein
MGVLLHDAIVYVISEEDLRATLIMAYKPCVSLEA